jgi:hypothetical protein
MKRLSLVLAVLVLAVGLSFSIGAQTAVGIYKSLVVDGRPAANISLAAKTLTDAQIKALPSTPISLISSPGAGYFISPIAVVLNMDATAGAYGNIDAAAWLGVVYNNAYGFVGYVGNDVAITNPLIGSTAFTDFLTNGSKVSLNLAPFEVTEDINQSAGGWGPMAVLQAMTSKENQPITIKVDNNGAGALTGGNSANTLAIKVLYVVLPTT